MRILVIGSGGREHALVWRLSRSTTRHHIVCAPGSPGIAELARCLPARSIQEWLAVAESVDAELTVVGPEAPLVDGVADLFRSRGRLILGPPAAAARIEGSKHYSKQLMTELGIPTARFTKTETPEEARRALDAFPLPVVLKADGLAAGKGVIVARTRQDAEAAIQTLGGKLVIEEFLTGEEVSFIALCDGRRAIPLEATQDHKPVHDGDQGPNTGGMGAYTDGRLLTAAQVSDTLDRVIQPVVERTAYTGFLYAGLILTADGPKVLEFNCRLGDPETQPLMHRLATDPPEILEAAARGNLAGARLDWRPDPSMCVVLAAAGYPGKVQSGDPIHGIPDAEAQGATVFQAGTKLGMSGLETAGGRVLGVTASGQDLAAAIAHTYRAVRAIRFDGMHYRTDIAAKGLRRW